MLHIVNLEEIQGLLLRLPEIVHDLESHDPNFSDTVKDWLVQAEQILVSNRLAVAGAIAALRGVLISAERGAMPAGLVLSGQLTKQKIKEATATDALRKAEELISNAIRADVAQLAEGERLTQQIVAVAERKGLIPTTSTVNGHIEMLNVVWHAMIDDPDLGAASTRLVGLVGAYDALILLDRMLTLPG